MHIGLPVAAGAVVISIYVFTSNLPISSSYQQQDLWCILNKLHKYNIAASAKRFTR